MNVLFIHAHYPKKINNASSKQDAVIEDVCASLFKVVFFMRFEQDHLVLISVSRFGYIHF